MLPLDFCAFQVNLAGTGQILLAVITGVGTAPRGRPYLRMGKLRLEQIWLRKQHETYSGNGRGSFDRFAGSIASCIRNMIAIPESGRAQGPAPTG